MLCFVRGTEDGPGSDDTERVGSSQSPSPTAHPEAQLSQPLNLLTKARLPASGPALPCRPPPIYTPRAQLPSQSSKPQEAAAASACLPGCICRLASIAHQSARSANQSIQQPSGVSLRADRPDPSQRRHAMTKVTSPAAWPSSRQLFSSPCPLLCSALCRRER